MHKVERFFFSPCVIKNVSECVAMPKDISVSTCHINMCEIASTLNLGVGKALSTATKVSEWAESCSQSYGLTS